MLNDLLAAIGLRRFSLAVVWWLYHPWANAAVPRLANDVLGAEFAAVVVVAGWVVAVVVAPTAVLWWGVCIVADFGSAVLAVGMVAALTLDGALFWYNWRLQIRHRYGGPNVVARQIARFRADERDEVRAKLDGYTARRHRNRSDSRFILLTLLELSDGDIATLRRLIEVATQDSRDLREWRPRRLWISAL